MNITLRLATDDDAATLAALCLEVQELHIKALPQMFKPIAPNDPDLINFYVRNFAQGCIAYIAEIEGEAVGYFFGQFAYREEGLFTYARSRFHIDQMSVKDGYRKQGIGKALMDKAFEIAREAKVKQVTLSVWTFNSGAIAFYDSTGFKAAYQTMYVNLDAD